MKKLITLFVLLFSFQGFSQELTGEQLLDKAIKYHDPNNNWETFNGTLNVTMKTPNKPNRDSEIKINLPEEYFYVKHSREENTTEYTLNKKDCKIALNGKNPSSSLKKK